jgi:hypothetical protein
VQTFAHVLIDSACCGLDLAYEFLFCGCCCYVQLWWIEVKSCWRYRRFHFCTSKWCIG